MDRALSTVADPDSPRPSEYRLPAPRHVELDGITDEDRLLRFDPSEAQRFAENLGIGFCHAEFFGDKDEVDEAVDFEELEFCAAPLLVRSSRSRSGELPWNRQLTRRRTIENTSFHTGKQM